MNNEYKIKGWVARDEYGLWFYREKPYKVEGTFCSHWTDKNGPNSEIPLDINIFPELTWKDEPIEVELIIKSCVKMVEGQFAFHYDTPMLS